MSYRIVPLADEHAPQVMAILNHYIENGFAAYFDQPLPAYFFERLRGMTLGYPALIALDDVGAVAGFAFLHAYHPAPTLRRTAEATYFIHPEHTRRGLGKLLLDQLIGRASSMGVDNIIASISSLNEDSIAFHGRNGFVECGRLAAAGSKFGRDFDVVYMRRSIA